MLTPSRNQRRAEQTQYNTRCVCQICTCGQHHCPKSSATRFQGETTNHHDYKAYKIEPSHYESCTHQYKERHYDPKALQTSYDKFYHPHQVEQGNEQMKKYEYKPSSGKFYGETEYNKNYKNKEINYQKPTECKHGYVPRKTKFEGTTTYKSEFSPKKSESYRPTSYQYERKKVPFQGKSTYDTDFKQFEIEKNTRQTEWACKYNPKKGKFYGESHYKQDYKAYEVEIEDRCPILDLPRYPVKCSPGKHHVNYSAEKNKWD